MPIRGRARDVGSSNITCASDAIFHHKRLLEIFRQLSTRHPSHNISSTASAKPYYYGDRLTWPIRLLRMSQRGDGKSSNQSKDAAMEPAERGVLCRQIREDRMFVPKADTMSASNYTCGPGSRQRCTRPRLHTRPLSPV